MYTWKLKRECFPTMYVEGQTLTILYQFVLLTSVNMQTYSQNQIYTYIIPH